MIIKGETTLFVRMILYCPECGTQHIDKPNIDIGWTNPPHKTHQCQNPLCQHLWRPYEFTTMGVANINDDVEIIQ